MTDTFMLSKNVICKLPFSFMCLFCLFVLTIFNEGAYLT